MRLRYPQFVLDAVGHLLEDQRRGRGRDRAGQNPVLPGAGIAAADLAVLERRGSEIMDAVALGVEMNRIGLIDRSRVEGEG
jgi:hypothetical protein